MTPPRNAPDKRILYAYSVPHYRTEEKGVMTVFRDRVRSGEAVVGTFVKTTSPQTIEVLARTALDFAVLDAEHAPFGSESLAFALGAAHRAALATLVRVPDHNAAFINACLDMGADGIRRWEEHKSELTY